MSRSIPTEQLASLAAQLTDGGLDEAGRERLREIIATDRAAARWLVEWLELHAMLDFDFGNQDRVAAASPLLHPPESLAPVESESRLPLAARSASAGRGGESSSRKSPRLHLWSSLAAAVLALTSYGLGVWTSQQMDSTLSLDPPVAALEQGTPEGAAESISIATVAGGVGAVFDDGISLGSRLSTGIVRLEKGIAQIAFDRGAVLILEGPAELELVDAATCRLLSGSLSAELLPDATGFSVAAHGIKVSDRDARFGLRCGPQRATEVHAFQADLRLVDSHGPSGQARELSAGQALRWHGNEATAGFRSNPHSFVTREEFVHRQRLSEEQAYARWADYSQRWLDDPAAILRYEFGLHHDPQIVNTIDPTQHVAVSRYAAPRWIGGRWADKRSMVFDGRTDVLDVPDHPDLRLDGAFSLAVWVHTRNYPQSAWGRIVGKGSGPDRNYGLWVNPGGQFLWQVCPDLDPESQEVWDLHSLLTAKCPLNEWLLVVGVMDADESRVYVNGVLHKVGEAPDKIATSDDPLTIGFYGNVPGHNEYFCGELDELILLNRALSPEEIREMYEAGRPDHAPIPGLPDDASEMSPQIGSAI